MDALDVLLLIALALAAYGGYRRGFVLMFLTYAGLGLGLVAGALVAPSVAKYGRSPGVQAALALGTVLVSAGLGDAAGWAIGNKVRSRAREVRAVSGIDRAGGSALSVAAVLLVTWFLALNLVNGPFPPVGHEIRGSLIVRTLGEVLPEPPPLIGELRRFLNTLGFPDVFAGLPPAPAGPVPAPTEAQVRQAFLASRDSTVEITGDACGTILEGTGFVAAPGYLVTNAHVVAGERATSVHQGGRILPGIVVLFDPKTDIAVVRVPELTAPVLAFDPSAADRGTVGAILGYPEGGPLSAEKAAVRSEIAAVGHDIYGRGTVDRMVYELQALVRPGNSGGPFVLPDGHVAGVVFAASTTDDHVGYAIASSEVEPLVQQAIGRSQPAGTGACTR